MKSDNNKRSFRKNHSFKKNNSFRKNHSLKPIDLSDFLQGISTNRKGIDWIAPRYSILKYGVFIIGNKNKADKIEFFMRKPQLSKIEKQNKRIFKLKIPIYHTSSGHFYKRGKLRNVSM